MLPPRKPKKEKRASRWKSPKHRDWVRGFACCNCQSTAGIECAHVRMGSGAGMGQKPDDWFCVPLCGPCHNGDQHTKLGEPKFWERYHRNTGTTVHELMDAICRSSPKSREIAQIKKERAND